MARSETRSGSEKSSEKGVLSRLIGAVTGEGHGDARSEADREITATDLLKEDHAKVRKLFKEYQNAPEGSKAAKKRIIDQVSRELEVHARIEEEIFYPACKALRDRSARLIVGESIEHHRQEADRAGRLRAGTRRSSPRRPCYGRWSGTMPTRKKAISSHRPRRSSMTTFS